MKKAAEPLRADLLTPNPRANRLLTLHALEQKLALRRSSLYDLMRTDADFPRPVQPMGEDGEYRWPEDDVDAWIERLKRRPTRPRETRPLRQRDGGGAAA